MILPRLYSIVRVASHAEVVVSILAWPILEADGCYSLSIKNIWRGRVDKGKIGVQSVLFPISSLTNFALSIIQYAKHQRRKDAIRKEEIKLQQGGVKEVRSNSNRRLVLELKSNYG
jgi:hypothetical protein